MRVLIVVTGMLWCASADAQVTWGEVRASRQSAGCVNCHPGSTPSVSQNGIPDLGYFYTARARINLMLEHASCEGEPAYYMPTNGCTPISAPTGALWAAWRDGGASMAGGPTGSTTDLLYANTWCDSGTPTRPGIKAILTQNCTGSCHNGAPRGDAPRWPQWLDFTKCETLLMASYYMPGHTKAEASIARSDDGTMPPGLPAGYGLSQNQRTALLNFFSSPQTCPSVCP